MKVMKVSSNETETGFAQAKRLADATAESLLEEPVLLSWFDRARDIESPKGVSECHQGCATPGVVDYAANRGGALVVDVDEGSFLFCYRPLGEFSGP